MSPEHHQALIDLVSRLVVAEDIDDHANSPLELLEELLERDGMRTRMDGFELKFLNYWVSTEKTERWRVQVRGLLVGQALHGSPRQRVMAARLFEPALRLPFGAATVTAGADVVAEWHADKLRLLDAVGEIVECAPEPMVRVALAKALRLHSEHDSHVASRERAAALLEAVEDDEAWLLGAIAWPWEIFEPAEVEARDRRLAVMLADRCEDGRALGAFLEQTLTEIVETKLSDNPAVGGPVLSLLQDATAIYAESLWKWGIGHAGGPVAPLAWMALAVLRAERGDVDADLEGAVKSDDAAVRRIAAQYLGSADWASDPTPTEIAALERLAGDEDPRVRNLISTSLPRMGQIAPRLAVRQALAPGAEEGDGRGADMPFHTVVEYGLDKLDDEQLDALSARLTGVMEPGYAAHQAFAELGRLDPRRMVDLWLARLRREREEDGGAGYRAVPYDDFRIEMLPGTGEDLVDLLGRLLEPLPTLAGWRRRELARIFWRLVVPGLRDDELDEVVAEREAEIEAAWQAIDDHGGRSDSDLVALADFLDETPWQVVLAAPNAVALLLERDEAAGGDGHRPLAEAIRAAMSYGGYGRTLGEASPRSAETARRAGAAIDGLEAGSAGARLFEKIAAAASREIDRDRRQDDEEMLGWH
ncbi:MAG: hypothetical protein H0X42_07505 [Solirubrobacterales bacterium]|nr:hypothetical protein [Solirubrobacterales bacterium]